MELREIADRLALRELVERYARAVDSRDYELAERLFLEDGELVGADFSLRGAAAIAKAMRRVERYVSTFHCIHNQLLELEPDQASGETTCTAHHVYEKDGERRKLAWGIRYQDRYQRSGDGWRFARRELQVQWTQDLPLES